MRMRRHTTYVKFNLEKKNDSQIWHISTFTYTNNSVFKKTLFTVIYRSPYILTFKIGNFVYEMYLVFYQFFSL